MNWLKLFRYDIRSGLLRWRYLCVPVLFWVPCFYNWIQISNAECVGTWMDYMIGCFKGLMPLASVEDFEFPILWFLVMAGCLFLNLDYPLNDLTDAGQQVIVRSVNKKGWFLSKCVWNLMSTALYVLLGALTALAFALINGGSAQLVNTPDVMIKALNIYTITTLTVGQTLMVAVVLPYLTLVTLNMLQMVLSLVMKPIFGFLICICMLVISLFYSSPYFIGNGAMAARSGIQMEGFVEPLPTALTCIGVMVLSIVVGIIRFDRMDHLRYEE